MLLYGYCNEKEPIQYVESNTPTAIFCGVMLQHSRSSLSCCSLFRNFSGANVAYSSYF